ncbi:MAG: S-layer homology domain-containing protein, partial [Clostridiales bacterium]|nr:S-layer homology domain-containing protein [Clostridiales bacterium]
KGMGAAQIDFYDRGEIPDYAAEFVGILVKAKVLTGYTDGTIRPNLNVQRSEAVKMLYGLF